MRSGLQAIVDAIRDTIPQHRRALVAVDGMGASGKTTIASTIASRITDRPVVLLHEDDFFNPAELRHARGRYSPEGFWLDTYNLSALRSWALDPLAHGDASFRARSFDRDTGESIRPRKSSAPVRAVVLVEGTFLHRDELAAYWDFSIFLDIGFEESARRMQIRNGHATSMDPTLLARYHDAQRIYFSAARPWERASLVIDNSLVERPTIIDPSQAAAAR